MHEFLFRSWRPSINVVEIKMFKTIPSARSMDRGGERKQSVVVVRYLMVLYPYVVSLLDYIDEWTILQLSVQ